MSSTSPGAQKSRPTMVTPSKTRQKLLKSASLGNEISLAWSCRLPMKRCDFHGFTWHDPPPQKHHHHHHHTKSKQTCAWAVVVVVWHLNEPAPGVVFQSPVSARRRLCETVVVVLGESKGPVYGSPQMLCWFTTHSSVGQAHFSLCIQLLNCRHCICCVLPLACPYRCLLAFPSTSAIIAMSAIWRITPLFPPSVLQPTGPIR